MNVKKDIQSLILEVERLRKKLHTVTENKNGLITYKQQLDAIMDNVPLEMSLKDRHGRFIRVNKKFEALFQDKNEDLVGTLPPIDHDPKLAATLRLSLIHTSEPTRLLSSS